MFKLCHISKKKAEWLLRSGFIPCEYIGKKTRCYLIKKTDVLAWLISKNRISIIIIKSE